MLQEIAPGEFDPAEFPEGETVPVMFYADWCGFCQRLAPAYDARARAAGDHPFARVNISDEETPVWDTYDIQVVPTIIVFRNGAPIAKKGGPLQDADLENILQRAGIGA